MPTIAPRNYLAKVDEFIAHWTLVDAALTPDVILTGNYTLATFTADRVLLLASIQDVQTKLNLNQGAAGDRDVRRAAIKERMRQFNQIVRGAFPNTQQARMVPKIPNINAATGEWIIALRDMASAWDYVNAILPIPLGAPIPLILSGGYTRALYGTDMTAIEAAFTAIKTTEETLVTAIRTRDAIFQAMYTRMRQYRLSVQGRFVATDPLLLSLPALVPPPGHTPDPVNVSGVWSPAILKAVITYSASADADLASYQLRACFGGTKYNVETEEVVATHAAGDLTPFETDLGLIASGSKVFYKVYVILNTGNEKGSRAISVVRP